MYHCEICNGTGYITYEEDGCEYAKPCKCQAIRKSLYFAEKSGLGELLKVYTFDRFKTDLGFQKNLYDKAQEYLKENKKWFTVLGKSGAGKSHICIAICVEMLKKGKEVMFISWLQQGRQLKSLINEKEYDEIIEQLKNVEVLYIDDFFKSENNTPPTNADIKLAYEIIGYRYNKSLGEARGYQTIISSECTLQQLISYDEAVIGRIIEMSGDYVKVLDENEAINYRLRNFI